MSVSHGSKASDVRTGAATSPDRTKLGVPFAGTEGQATIVLSLGAPALAAANNISTAQAVGAAGNLTITGVLASGGVATLDVPRNVTVKSTDAGDTTQTATVTGTDVYGQAMSELLTFNGTSAVLGAKAFKTVTRIAISALLAGSATAGTGSKLGLPYRPVVGGFIRGRFNEDTSDSGTYVAPVRTTSTTTSNDVRGTYTPAGTLNASNVVTVVIGVANGPDDSSAFGIGQV